MSLEIDFCTAFWRQLATKPLVLSLDQPVDPRNYKTRSARLVPPYPRDKFKSTVSVKLTPLRQTKSISTASFTDLNPSTTISDLKYRYARHLGFKSDGKISAALKLIKVLNRRSNLKDSSTLDDLRQSLGGGTIELSILVMPALESLSKTDPDESPAVSAPTTTATRPTTTATRANPDSGSAGSKTGDCSSSAEPAAPSTPITENPRFWSDISAVVSKWTISDPAETDRLVALFKASLK